MERWAGRVALVTGASAGIGAATVRRLVGHGMKVVGCARNVQTIQEMADELKHAPGSLMAIRCDVTREADVLAMFDVIKSTYGVVDVCVNNAGLSHYAPILTGKTEDWRNMFDVNVIGLCTCTREAVMLMDEKGVDDGHVFLLNSFMGHAVLNYTWANMYTATKFAVTAITEGIRNELMARKSHIRVTAISAGLVQTDFLYRIFPDRPEWLTASLTPYRALAADDIVDSLVYALSAPGRTQVHDIKILPIEGPTSTS